MAEIISMVGIISVAVQCDIQDQKSHRFPSVLFYLLCSPVRAVGYYPNACRLQSALEDGF